jgi:hypothetical protein
MGKEHQEKLQEPLPAAYRVQGPPLKEEGKFFPNPVAAFQPYPPARKGNHPNFFQRSFEVFQIPKNGTAAAVQGRRNGIDPHRPLLMEQKIQQPYKPGREGR